MAQPMPRIISGGVPSIRVYFILCSPIQARILFETFFGVEGVESSPRSCAKEFRHLGLGPFVLPQPGITGRSLQQECGAAASVRAGIPHPFKCAAAAVQLLSHPQTHRVGVRMCYHHPFSSPLLIYHTSEHTLWVFGRSITPPGLSHPPWAPCELHFITRGTQDIIPPTGYHIRW